MARPAQDPSNPGAPVLPPDELDDDSTQFTNPDDPPRRKFWADAAARLDRRVSKLEEQLKFSIFTWPVLLAASLALAALMLAGFAVYKVVRRG